MADYEALGQNWRDFWPLKIWHYPNYNFQSTGIRGFISDEQLEKWEHEGKTESLAWHPACRELLLFYRDSLRTVWHGTQVMGEDEFLLGLTDLNEEARKLAKSGDIDFTCLIPLGLELAWRVVVKQFPTAVMEGRVQIGMLWKMGDFSLVPDNDFQRAFYLLFRQSWRARVCPRCKRFFVARKPKQIFCTTKCSAGNRLASKRSWWNHVGAKRRAKQRRAVSKKSRGERKSR